MARKPRADRLAIPDLAIRESVVRARLDALAAGPDAAGATRAVVGANTRSLLETAADAAHARAPRTWRVTDWWRGTLNDVGYRSLHAASAELATLYDPNEIRAVLPEAVNRIQGVLGAADPRRVAAQQALALPDKVDGARLRQLIAAGYEAADDAYARVRGFRNVVILAALLVLVVGGTFVGYVMAHPDVVPLCFQTPGPDAMIVCPSSEAPVGQGGPSSADIVVVCLLGLLGASLSAAVSLRNLQGSTAPYSVPVALTALKVPTGALTATIAIIAIRAGFVPGLTALDSQAQIIAYALLFGYAQQLLTGLVDRQGQSVLAGLPGRGSDRSGGTAVVSTLEVGMAPAVAPGTAAVTDLVAVTSSPADDDESPDDGALDLDLELDPDQHIDDSDLPDAFQQDVPDGGVDEAAPDLEVIEDDDDESAPGAGSVDDDDLAEVEPDDDLAEVEPDDEVEDVEPDDEVEDVDQPDDSQSEIDADGEDDVRTLTPVPAGAAPAASTAGRATTRRGGSR